VASLGPHAFPAHRRLDISTYLTFPWSAYPGQTAGRGPRSPAFGHVQLVPDACPARQHERISLVVAASPCPVGRSSSAGAPRTIAWSRSSRCTPVRTRVMGRRTRSCWSASPSPLRPAERSGTAQRVPDVCSRRRCPCPTGGGVPFGGPGPSCSPSERSSALDCVAHRSRSNAEGQLRCGLAFGETLRASPTPPPTHPR